MKKEILPVPITWGAITLPEGDLVELGDEHILITLQKTRSELCLSIMRNGVETLPEMRIYIGTHKKFSLVPALPDKPVVIRPLQRVSILPHEKMRLFIVVPLAITLVAESGKNRTVVFEELTMPLSKTWFGDTVNGEHAYAVDSPLHQSFEQYSVTAKEAVCPILITNSTDTPLSFKRLNLRVPGLSLYQGKGLIFTNLTHVVYRGADQLNQISYESKAPEVGFGLESIAAPRDPQSKNVLSKSMNFFKSLTMINER